MDLQQWTDNLMKEVSNVSKHLAGFAVFYSPVIVNPSLLVIGYNPGGNQKDFLATRDCTVPTQHEYFTETYALARAMKKLFRRIDRENLLQESVKTNLIFFRSVDVKSLSLTNDLKRFCFEKTEEIIDKLQPKVIVAEGIGTFNEVARLLKRRDVEYEPKDGKPRQPAMHGLHRNKTA